MASVSDIGVLTFSSFPRAGVAAVAASTAAAARIFSPERTPAGAASSERVLISSRNRAVLTSSFVAFRFGGRGGGIVVGGRHVSLARRLK